MASARRTAPGLGAPLFRSAAAVEVEAKARRIRFIASDESVDRYGDIIRAKGWELENFRANPVLMFGHGRTPGLPVIGKVEPIKIVGKKLVADCEFMPEGMSDFADQVWRAVDAGFLRASSVGFAPTLKPNLIWADDDPDHEGWPTGFEFIGQELLELSVVPVPANPQALAVARDLGLSPEVQRRLFPAEPRALARAAAEHRRRTITIHRRARHPAGSSI